MDPLSVAASCIAVLGAGGTAIRGLKKLIDLHRVPDVLLAVINEVSDLQEIKLIFQMHQDTSTSFQSLLSATTITQLLNRAQEILLALDQIINYRLLIEIRHSGEEKMVINRSAWLREEHHIRRLQERLRVVRLDIAAGLAVLNL